MAHQDAYPRGDHLDRSWAYSKHFLITGASSGIGLHVAKHFVGICRKLTLVSRNTDGKLDEAIRQLRRIKESRAARDGWIDSGIRTCSLDVRDKQSVGSLIREAYDGNDQIDAFVSCAGGSHRFALLECMSTDDIDEIIDVNAKAPIYWLRELLVLMKHNAMAAGELKRGHIIMLSSRSGERPLPNLSVYAAAKACIEKLMEAVRAEYASYRIAFTLINPGSIDTAFTDRWPQDIRAMHNAESMTVAEAIAPVIHALESQFVYNKISYESLEQWIGEPGVLSARVD